MKAQIKFNSPVAKSIANKIKEDAEANLNLLLEKAKTAQELINEA